MKDDKFTANALNHVETLRQAAKSKGITHQEIAAKTGLIQTNVARTLSGKYIPRLDLFLKLAEATGVRVSITVQTGKP